MKPDDAKEWTESLGQIGVGMWRQIALAKRMGVPKALGLKTEDWVQQHLGGYIRLSIEDRREAVLELKEEGLSQRAIGEVLGVDKRTVDRDVDGANAPPDEPEANKQAGASEDPGANAPPPPKAAKKKRQPGEDPAADRLEIDLEAVYEVHVVSALFGMDQGARVEEILTKHRDEYEKRNRLSVEETWEVIRELGANINALLERVDR